ncbi:MAG: hypothetical protein KAS32_06970 [Candidatus Peribacteraceae bacterium]|nr:hypothetical protein [Candidatus Peribacteraceae bacterium]
MSSRIVDDIKLFFMRKKSLNQFASWLKGRFAENEEKVARELLNGDEYPGFIVAKGKIPAGSTITNIYLEDKGFEKDDIVCELTGGMRATVKDVIVPVKTKYVWLFRMPICFSDFHFMEITARRADWDAFEGVAMRKSFLVGHGKEGMADILINEDNFVVAITDACEIVLGDKDE